MLTVAARAFGILPGTATVTRYNGDRRGVRHRAVEAPRGGDRAAQRGQAHGANVALSQLDLAIEDGEFFCLLGPSGCGKTTTLNLIGGFVAPTEGTIWLRGRQIEGLRTSAPSTRSSSPMRSSRT